MQRLPAGLLLALLAVASLVAFGAALVAGSVPLSVRQVMEVLGGGGSDLHRVLVLELRLPRAAAAFVTGGLLALAGALLQVLLRNPLADPYVLGVSGGASVGALLAILAGGVAFSVQGAALLGALISTALVLFAGGGVGSWSPTRLLLTGVVLAAGWGAMISLLLAIAPDTTLRGMLFWMMGDLSGAGMPGWNGGVLALVLLILLPAARPLDLLAAGEQRARTLGVPVTLLQLTVYLAASLLTATAVTTAGTVSFVGLVVPHAVRLLGGHAHRLLLPGSVLAGGALLVAADTLARTALAPRQLPVGVLTAFIGVPLFLWLLTRGARR
ncbi:MAG TPA: iron ABC transporter permease [Thiotrichales bacterium]|nr:iron ABC transporter permease [Thiotrichales bacterium]